jgi:hypothetical protein
MTARRRWSRSHWRRAVLCVAALACLLLAGCTTRVTGHGTPGARPTQQIPVVFVHGATNKVCPGLDVKQWSAGIATMLQRAGWSPSLLDSVGFDQCDTDYSERIGSFDLNTPLATVAHALAWYVYDTYTARGTTVDMVGHSLGGMLIRYSMARVAAHDPAYPKRIAVANVVTFSTPYLGVETNLVCAEAAAVGCTDLAPGSSFVAQLTQPVPAGQNWVVFGSLARCDLVAPADSTAAPGATAVIFERPCYAHTAYMTDRSALLNAIGPTDHRHSLAAMMSVLLTGRP